MPSASEETLVFPDDPLIHQLCLPWSHVFELARLMEAAKEDDRREFDIRPQELIKLSAKFTNPARISGLVPLKKPPAPISIALRQAFDVATEAELPDLQKRLTFSLWLDLPKPGMDGLRIRFEPTAIGKPCALTRAFGPSRFLMVKLTEGLERSLSLSSRQAEAAKCALKAFFDGPLRIGPRAYHMVLRKEKCIWMLNLAGQDWAGAKLFINDLMDLNINKELSVAKWAARLSLLVSPTVETITFKPECVRRVPDLYSDSLLISPQQMGLIANGLGLTYMPSAIEGSHRNKPCVWRLGSISGDGNPLIQLWDSQIKSFQSHAIIKFKAWSYCEEKGQFIIEEDSFIIPKQYCVNMGARGPSRIMTDGAAALSRAAAWKISRCVESPLASLPAAFQGRVGFAKGLWYLDPYLNLADQSDWIEIRDSQWKADPVPRASFHFNLCRVSRSVESSSVGKQMIPLLISRGVPNCAIVQLLRHHILAKVRSFNTEDPVKLAHALTKQAGLMAIRKHTLRELNNTKHDPTIARPFKDWGSEPSGVAKPTEQLWTSDRLDALSLSPQTSEELVAAMLTAGFSPRNRFIVERLRKIKENAIQEYLKFKVPVGESVYVYVMPDPTGALEEDQVFLQLSNFHDQSTGVRISRPIGPAIVARSPCVSATDVRKVQLVDNNVLGNSYFDVLVCSIRGQRSLLSLLSGGDYDGDQVFVGWNPSLVENFNNAEPEKHCEIREDEYFDCCQVGTIEKQLLPLYHCHSKEFVKKAQYFMLQGLFIPAYAGSTAWKHSTAEYILGADHPFTNTLAEVYVKCLDAPKLGLALKPEKEKELKKELANHLNKIILPDGEKLPNQRSVYQQALPQFLKNDPRCQKEGNQSKFFKYQREGRTHIYDDLMIEGQKIFNSYKKSLGQKDCSSHSSRASDRDHDLSQMYSELKIRYEFDKKKRGSWAVWSGVLRPLQRKMLVLNEENRKAVEKNISSKQSDALWSSEFNVINNGTRAEQTAGKQLIIRKYHDLTFEEAMKDEDEEALEGAERHLLTLEEFRMVKMAFLNGLGPSGYALLKASCLSFVCNAECYLPYEVAFREVCYLKARACANRTATLQQGPLSQPPHTVAMECYLSTVVKKGILTGRHYEDPEILAQPA